MRDFPHDCGTVDTSSHYNCNYNNFILVRQTIFIRSCLIVGHTLDEHAIAVIKSLPVCAERIMQDYIGNKSVEGGGSGCLQNKNSGQEKTGFVL